MPNCKEANAKLENLYYKNLLLNTTVPQDFLSDIQAPFTLNRVAFGAFWHSICVCITLELFVKTKGSFPPREIENGSGQRMFENSGRLFYTNPYTKTRGNGKSSEVANVRDSGMSR